MVADFYVVSNLTNLAVWRTIFLISLELSVNRGAMTHGSRLGSCNFDKLKCHKCSLNTLFHNSHFQNYSQTSKRKASKWNHFISQLCNPARIVSTVITFDRRHTVPGFYRFHGEIIFRLARDSHCIWCQVKRGFENSRKTANCPSQTKQNLHFICFCGTSKCCLNLNLSWCI